MVGVPTASDVRVGSRAALKMACRPRMVCPQLRTPIAARRIGEELPKADAFWKSCPAGSPSKGSFGNNCSIGIVKVPSGPCNAHSDLIRLFPDGPLYSESPIIMPSLSPSWVCSRTRHLHALSCAVRQVHKDDSRGITWRHRSTSVLTKTHLSCLVRQALLFRSCAAGGSVPCSVTWRQGRSWPAGVGLVHRYSAISLLGHRRRCQECRRHRGAWRRLLALPDRHGAVLQTTEGHAPARVRTWKPADRPL